MTTDNGKKIVRQVEYYFGDLNLQRDTFLLDEMKKDEGWVSVDTMMKVFLLLITDIHNIFSSKDLLKSSKTKKKVSRMLWGQSELT